MKTYLQTMWWLLLLRGIALLLFGFFAVAWPALTLYGLALGFAVYLIAAGIINIIGSLLAIGRLPLWFLSLVVAAIEVGVGVYALKHLSLTVGTLIILLGLVLVVRGVMEIISAFGDSYAAKHRAMYALTGALSLVAGIAIWLHPAAGGIAFSWILGLYGIVGGAFLVTLALEARSELALQ